MNKLIISLLALVCVTSINAAKSISIDLSNQRIYAKNGGRVVFSGRISSGKSGHSTPTGTFRILEKDRHHVSNKYPEPNGGAKMPYMLRLTNGGIAVHQGYVPNYPASHGCIRVPKSTAIKLWRWSNIGTKVHVYGTASSFRYVKKSKRRVKKYAKKRRKFRKRQYLSKSKKYIRKVHKKRLHRTKKRYIAKKSRRYKRSNRKVHYARRSNYKIVEIYDGW